MLPNQPSCQCAIEHVSAEAISLGEMASASTSTADEGAHCHGSSRSGCSTWASSEIQKALDCKLLIPKPERLQSATLQAKEVSEADTF